MQAAVATSAAAAADAAASPSLPAPADPAQGADPLVSEKEGTHRKYPLWQDLLSKDPENLTIQTLLVSWEAELLSLFSEIEAQHSPVHRRQSCLSRKRTADKEVEELQQAEEYCRVALLLSSTKLAAAQASKIQIDAEYAKLKFIGTEPTPSSAPAITDVMAFVTALMASGTRDQA